MEAAQLSRVSKNVVWCVTVKTWLCWSHRMLLARAGPLVTWWSRMLKVLALITEMFLPVGKGCTAVFPTLTGHCVLTFKATSFLQLKSYLVQTARAVAFCLLTEKISSVRIPSDWEMSCVWQRSGSFSKIQVVIYGYYMWEASLLCYAQLDFPFRFVYLLLIIYVYINEKTNRIGCNLRGMLLQFIFLDLRFCIQNFKGNFYIFSNFLCKQKTSFVALLSH